MDASGNFLLKVSTFVLGMLKISLCLELQLKIFLSIADVNASKFISVVIVVKVESWPDQASADNGCLIKCLLEIPGTLWLVMSNTLQESIIEWCIRPVKSDFISIVLNISEVDIVIE